MKIKLLILTLFILFVAFFVLMIGLIQDLVSNEFVKFNTIFKTIVFNLFNHQWQGIMNSIYLLASWKVLGIISLITIAVIFIHNKNKLLELSFFITSFIGIFILSKGIPWIFHLLLGSKLSTNFPNEKSMLILSFFGFCFIMLIRHNLNYLLSIGMFFIFIFVILLFSISSVFLQHVNPSDIMAGYVFSSVWLTGTIFSLEMFRFVSLLKMSMLEKKAS
jgi:hypothetical protein